MIDSFRVQDDEVTSDSLLRYVQGDNQPAEFTLLQIYNFLEHTTHKRVENEGVSSPKRRSMLKVLSTEHTKDIASLKLDFDTQHLPSTFTTYVKQFLHFVSSTTNYSVHSIREALTDVTKIDQYIKRISSQNASTVSKRIQALELALKWVEKHSQNLPTSSKSSSIEDALEYCRKKRKVDSSLPTPLPRLDLLSVSFHK